MKVILKMSEQEVYELIGPVVILLVALIIVTGFAYG
jgi:hypothetical protein